MNALFATLFLCLNTLTAFNVESNPDEISILATCHAYVNVSLDPTGQATITPEDIDAGSYSTLGPVTLSVSPTNFDCSYLGDTVVVILTVTDINGDYNQCYSEVIVEDKMAPLAACIADITLALDASGNATLTGEMVDGGSVDNCGSVILTPQKTNFNCSDIGPAQTIIIDVTDPSGNLNQCWTDVTVVDNLGPTAACFADIYLTLDPVSGATLTPAMVDGGSTDNCDLTFTLSKTHFSCRDAGTTTVLMDVSDPGGNTNTCWTNVHIADADCDGIADACDVCPEGDDSIDNNEDGIADCSQLLAFEGYDANWDCSSKNKQKIVACKNGNNKCIKYEKIQDHLDDGYTLGPCVDCPTALMQKKSKLNYTADTELIVTPNPSKGQFTIHSSHYLEDGTAILYNIAGEQILEKRKCVGHELNINEPLEPGWYILMVIEDDLAQSTQILISR